MTVVIVGFGSERSRPKELWLSEGERSVVRQIANINPYLIPGPDVWVSAISGRVADRALMLKGNQPTDGGYLNLSPSEARNIIGSNPSMMQYEKRYVGSEEMIHANPRFCIWGEDEKQREGWEIPSFKK